jgi:hypothetical protein
MTPIQPILIAALAAVSFVHVKAFGSRLLSRVLTLGLVALGVVFVINPQFTNQLAHLVGVGRGADLILYALFPATVSMFLHLYRRNRQLEEKLTELAREMALHGASRMHHPTNL